MRGTVAAQALRGAVGFQISMRGNEMVWWVCPDSDIAAFQIPMRGNESRGGILKKRLGHRFKSP